MNILPRIQALWKVNRTPGLPLWRIQPENIQVLKNFLWVVEIGMSRLDNWKKNKSIVTVRSKKNLSKKSGF